MRTAIVRNGVVDHIVIAGSTYLAPLGAAAVPSETANIGDKYDGEKFWAQINKDISSSDLEDRVYVMTDSAQRREHVFDVGSSVSVNCNLLQSTRTDLSLLARWGAENPSSIRLWFDNAGTKTQLTGAQFVALERAVGDAVLNLYEKSANLVDYIHNPNRQPMSFDDISTRLFAISSRDFRK